MSSIAPRFVGNATAESKGNATAEKVALGVTARGRGWVSGLGGVQWYPVGEAGLPAEVLDKIGFPTRAWLPWKGEILAGDKEGCILGSYD